MLSVSKDNNNSSDQRDSSDEMNTFVRFAGKEKTEESRAAAANMSLAKVHEKVKNHCLREMQQEHWETYPIQLFCRNVLKFSEIEGVELTEGSRKLLKEYSQDFEQCDSLGLSLTDMDLFFTQLESTSDINNYDIEDDSSCLESFGLKSSPFHQIMDNVRLPISPFCAQLLIACFLSIRVSDSFKKKSRKIRVVTTLIRLPRPRPCLEPWDPLQTQYLIRNISSPPLASRRLVKMILPRPWLIWKRKSKMKDKRMWISWTWLDPLRRKTLL
jgi:hypothetical protein